MKKVLLLGATGMLGSAVYDVVKERYELVLAVRSKEKIVLLENTYGGTAKHAIVEFDAQKMQSDPSYYPNFLRSVGDIDYAINAIGITQQFADQDPALTYFVNGDLPNTLSETFGPRLIHIATDGVYDGKNGPYDEIAPKSPIGTYAISKSNGEPKGSLVLRTSIIGRELESKTGLLEWFLNQQGKTIKGFKKHLWNGITAKEFGKVCHRIMSDPQEYPRNGLFHIFSDTVSKYDMLCAFKEKFNVDCEIVPDEGTVLNRTLSTVYDMNSKLAIPTFSEMLAEL